ncbi:MAG: Smr/MutS family protein [Acidobacteriota bacterium]
MNTRTLETLELKNFLELAARHVHTAPGRRRVLEIVPCISRAQIIQELEITRECIDFITLNGKFGLSGMDDPYPIMDHLHIDGTSLEPKQILSLEKLLSTSRQLRNWILQSEPKDAYPHLKRIVEEIPDFRQLLAEIGGKILPNGELDDNASSELHAIRKELTERRYRIHRTLESIMRSRSQAIQEEIITFRNDRFVIPVRTDSRNLIPGVVHGLSSSGQTTFLEPLTVINQNNDLVRLHEQEAMEIHAILRNISDCFRNSMDSIRSAAEILTVLDVFQAKARLAVEFDCIKPDITDEGAYEVHDVRNILLEYSLRASGTKPVPISLRLATKHHALVISGPNAGGKTVTLKTLGLVSLMAQMGFHIPARKARLPVFKQIFADIGDQQSMAANLSTFTAHMRNIAEMDDHIQPPSLVLLDEAGTGTDPDEGAALAIALIDYFRNIGATVVASTHYPRLKMWASQTHGIQNASVEFDEKTLQPTYRLILGTAGASSGIEIARRMHVKEEIMRAAEDLVDPAYAQVRMYLKQLKETLDEQNIVRATLEEEKAAVSQKLASMEKEFNADKQKQQEEFQSRLEKITRTFQVESERATRKIKDRIESSRLKKAIAGEAANLRRKALRMTETLSQNRDRPSTTNETEKNIAEGDSVMVLSLDREGKVESISDDTCIIAIGAIRYHADKSDLRLIPESSRSAGIQTSNSASYVEVSEELREYELNVIGLQADEALARVDKFLDRCYLEGVEKVRIIHGHGKGVLRKAIAGMLRNHLQVEGFNSAPPEMGGGGATVVELKQ